MSTPIHIPLVLHILSHPIAAIFSASAINHFGTQREKIQALVLGIAGLGLGYLTGSYVPFNRVVIVNPGQEALIREHANTVNSIFCSIKMASLAVNGIALRMIANRHNTQTT